MGHIYKIFQYSLSLQILTDSQRPIFYSYTLLFSLFLNSNIFIFPFKPVWRNLVFFIDYLTFPVSLQSYLCISTLFS